MRQSAGRIFFEMGAGRIFQKVGLFRKRRTNAKSRRSPASSAPAPASRSVGRYLLREPLGQGAMGEVWRAMDPQIGRAVAVKILNLPEGVSGRQKAEWEHRFVREARAAGALSHPGIVTIHDVGMAPDGRPFIVMELVDGLSLYAVMEAGLKPPERMALEWGAQVAEALDAAHGAGVVHRDVKPANVLIDKEGRAQIADFGIARLSESDLTHDGRFLGSPAFASPEQLRGGSVDGRSDLFSLGATLYTLLTGARPFQGEDLPGLAYAICHLEPKPPRGLVPRLSREGEAVVMKALAKEPEKRYATGREMAEDLREAAAGRSPRQAVVLAPAQPVIQEQESLPEAEPHSPRRVARGLPQTGAAMLVALPMAVAVATLGGYLLSRSQARSSWRTESAGFQAAAAPGSLGTEWPGGGEAGAARMRVRVAHDFQDGVLTVWSGKRRLLHAPLPVPASGEVAGWDLRLPAGEHQLRVRILSAAKGIDLESEQTMSVQKEQRYRLHARVKERPSPRLELICTND